VCRKERLTFYNFLIEHTVNEQGNTAEQIKTSINGEYGIYFRKQNQPEGLARKVDIYREKRSVLFELGSTAKGNTLNE